ncbi:MAG: hypothetical protein JW818_20195, partial [Pirellulales bacterium]|nr:hypothetical protein [Pirellulales bacterium]
PVRPAAPAQPPSGRKVARLITSDAADSTLNLAEDGNLPELKLHESLTKDASQQKKTSSNPLVLMAVLSASILACILMLFWDGSGGGHDDRKQAVEQIIRDKFFNTPGGELEPYQQWLREAQLAAERGNTAQEQQLYRRVLDRLHAERDRFDRTGLTGSIESDDELEELVLKMLKK